MLRFNEIELLQKIERLPKQLRVAFAAACAQRMMIAYAKFSTLTGRGNPEALSKILSRLWNDLAENVMSVVEIDKAIGTCMDFIPKDEDSPGVMEEFAAEGATSALAYAFRCRRSGAAQEAAWAAQCAYNALDQYAISDENLDLNAAGAEDHVLSDPLIQAELARQKRDLDELLHKAVTLEELQRRSEKEATEFLP